jgi:outer membrane protein TolC
VEFTAVFIASSELAARQDTMAEAQGRVTQSLVKLYQSLGGGWEMRLNRNDSGE